MKRFLSSFVFATRGIAKAFKEQTNLKIQSGCAVIVFGWAWYFRIPSIEWMILLVMISLVISLELMNTAIEDFVDLVSPERRPLAGKIKDIAAGAVLVATMGSIAVGILVFGKYVF